MYICPCARVWAQNSRTDFFMYSILWLKTISVNSTLARHLRLELDGCMSRILNELLFSGRFVCFIITPNIHTHVFGAHKESFDGSIQSAGFYVADFVLCAECALRCVCVHCTTHADYHAGLLFYCCHIAHARTYSVQFIQWTWKFKAHHKFSDK